MKNRVKHVVFSIEHDPKGTPREGCLPSATRETILDAGPEPVEVTWRTRNTRNGPMRDLKITGPKVDIILDNVTAYYRHVVEMPLTANLGS